MNYPTWIATHHRCNITAIGSLPFCLEKLGLSPSALPTLIAMAEEFGGLSTPAWKIERTESKGAPHATWNTSENLLRHNRGDFTRPLANAKSLPY